MLSEAQKKSRMSGIGGSDAGAVLRLNPFMSPLDVYNSKLGIDQMDISNDAIYWGNRLEDMVAQEYARRTDTKVRKRHKLFRHPDYDHMIANVDRTVDNQNKILECKTANAFTRDKWGPSGSDEVPDSYLIQCMHYMIVLDKPVADLAVLIGGNDFRTYTIGFDQKLADMIIEHEHDFWNKHVLKKNPPAPYTLSELDDLYKKDNGKSITASDDEILWFTELKTTNQHLKSLSDYKKEIVERLKRSMGEAQTLVDQEGNRLCSWKTQARNALDQKAFKAECPDLYESFVKESTTRVFRDH